MEAMHMGHAKSGTQSQHVWNYTWGKWSPKACKYCERKVCVICEEHVISLNCLMNPIVKVLLKSVIHFSTSLCWYAFSNVYVQISRLLVYRVRISSKATIAQPLSNYFCVFMCVLLFDNILTSVSASWFSQRLLDNWYSHTILPQNVFQYIHWNI